MKPIKKPAPDRKTIVLVGMEGWSKKGGQGDYIRELSDALSRDDHLVIVINPYFRQPHADISGKKGTRLFSIDLPVGQGDLKFDIYHNRINKVHYLRFKDGHDILYPEVYPDWLINNAHYSDSLYAFIEAVILSRIPMHLMMQLGITPDILHFNDWQSAYGPPYVDIFYRRSEPYRPWFQKTGTALTIHNMAYQGLTRWGLWIQKHDPINLLLGRIFPPDGLFIAVYDHGHAYEVDTFAITGFPRRLQFQMEGGAECWSDVPGYGGRHNVLKFGIERADKIVAVSKGNWGEIQRDDLGFGLGRLVARRASQGAVDFVWNGVNMDNIHPSTLKELTEIIRKNAGLRFTRFDVSDPDLLEKRMQNKKALRSKINQLIKRETETCFGYLDESAPDAMIVSGVSRLVRQKGYSLLFQPLDFDHELDIRYGERLADALMRLRTPDEGKLQFVFMGTAGDPDGQWVAEELKWLSWQYSGQVAFIRKFDPILANQIRAGSDLFFMPSQYEPGGIANIQAAILGALCVITYTGGLIDFLEHGGTDPEFVAAPFYYGAPWSLKQTGRDFVRAFRIAMNIYHFDPEKWRRLVGRAMQLNVDWSFRVRDYLSIYEAAQKAASAP